MNSPFKPDERLSHQWARVRRALTMIGVSRAVAWARARGSMPDLKWERRLRPVGFWAAWMVVSVVCLGRTVLAEEQRPFWQAPDDAQVVVKHVTGELSFIRPSSIGVVYQRDEKKGMDYEMALPLDDTLRLVHKRHLDELRIGDVVRVTYEERAWKTDEGLERLQRKATELRFLRPAKTALQSGSG